MSGYKRATVTISEEEYRRLHQADMKRRFQRNTEKKTKNQGQTEQLARTVEQMENRQQQLEQALNELSQGLDQNNAEAMEEMLMQNAVHYERMIAFLEEMASDADETVELTSQRFTEELQREREEYRQSLQALVQRFDTQEEREEARAELARQWLGRSHVLADFIQEQFDHERFLPGRLGRILASLDFADSNLAQDFVESSLQGSQQAFLQLSELHMELEHRVLEWQAAYGRAYTAISDILSELESNPTVNAIGLQGDELREQVQLDFWTNGKYRWLMGECKRFLVQLTQDQESISTEALMQIHAGLIRDIESSYESIVYEARLKALNSQLRMNIAERALEALEVHGFKLNRSGYLNEDMRDSFLAQLDSADGSQVTIRVLPSEQDAQELTNELVVITEHPYMKTEHEARMQWEELSRSLRQFDLNVSRPEVGAAPPAPVPEQDRLSPLSDEKPAELQRYHNV